MNYDFAQIVRVNNDEVMVMFNIKGDEKQGKKNVKILTGVDEQGNTYSALGVNDANYKINAQQVVLTALYIPPPFVLSCPVVTLQQNTLGNGTKQIVATWTTIANIDHYHAVIATDASGAPVIWEGDVSTANKTQNVSAGDYWVAVYPYDNSGHSNTSCSFNHINIS